MIVRSIFSVSKIENGKWREPVSERESGRASEREREREKERERKREKEKERSPK